MKKFTLYMFFGYAAFTSCSGDIADFSLKDNLRPLEISASLNMDASQTKAEGPVMGSSLPKGSKLGMCLYAKSNNENFTPYGSEESHYNRVWVNNGNESTPNWASTPPMYLNNMQAHVFAYYPHSTANQPVTLSDDKTKVLLAINAGNTDYLYNAFESTAGAEITNVVSSQSPSIGLNMKHALSLISFSFTHGELYPGECKIKSMEVSDIYTAGKLELSSGNGSIAQGDATKGTKSISYYSSDKGYTSLNGAFSFKNQNNFGALGISDGNIITSPGNFHFFAIPQDDLTNVKIKVKIDGELYETALTGIEKWEAGRAYQYKLLLNRVGLVASGSISGRIGGLVQGSSIVFDAVDDLDLGLEGVIGSRIINYPKGTPPAIDDKDGYKSTYTDYYSKGKASKRFQVARKDVERNGAFTFSWTVATGRNAGDFQINREMIDYNEDGISQGWRLPTDKEWRLIYDYESVLDGSDLNFDRLSRSHKYFTGVYGTPNNNNNNKENFFSVAIFYTNAFGIDKINHKNNTYCRIRYVRDIN